MEYLDFELRIGTSKDAEYPVAVVRSPVGEVSAMVRIPIDESAFVRDLEILETMRGPATETGPTNASDQPRRTVGLSVADESATAKEIGLKLFEALFLPEIRSSYRSSLAASRKDGKGLRLRLRIEAPELAALPWEFLFDAAEGDHICLNLETPLTRYLELNRPTPPLKVQPPIRILGMVASPRDLPALDTSLEKQRIATAVEHLQDRGDLQITWVEGETWRDLQAELANGPWHIFHFIGHGGFDHSKGEGLVLFCDDGGQAHSVSAVQLGRLFAGHPSLRLALINACEGARISDSSLYSSIGTVLMQRGIPAVVSMQYAISDKAALEFSRLFYDALARGESVDAAVTEARTAISFTAAESIEWATPVLHMRSPDGHLFDLDTTGLVFRNTERTEIPLAASLQPDALNRPASAPRDRYLPAGSDEGRGLAILLRRVKQFWIEGVLETSLFHATMIDLGVETLREAVENPWGAVVERPAARSEPLAPEQSIADLFDAEGGSLLILGEPGSGKTTSLLGLARTLIARAEHDPGLSIPVVFNLSSWADSHATLVDWMAAELSAKYQIPRNIGRAWLQAGRILPLLDGLDEQVAEKRAACVDAISGYTSETGLTGAVVCCRFREYVELPNRLVLNAAVRLLQLQDRQVQDYLAAGGDALAGLRTAMSREPALRFDARSPLMLSLMVRAYWGLSAADIEHESTESATARRRNLMDAYVSRMFRNARQRWAT